MTTITLCLDTNTRAHLESDGDFDDAPLDHAFSVLVNKHFYRSPAYKHGYDGRKHYYQRAKRSFPTGLYRDIRLWLKKAGHKVILKDSREGICRAGKVPTRLGGDLVLRDYQVSSVQNAIKFGRGVIHAATGSGKSEIMAALIKTYRMPCTLVVTSRATLVQQTRERLAWRLGVDPYDIGMISQGSWVEGELPIYVGLISTLGQPKWAKRRCDLNDRCQLLLLDEAHHSGAASWYKVTQNIKAYHRFGLTGTPKGRSDGKDLALRAVCGKVVAHVTAQALVKRGLLAKPHVYFTEVNKPKLHFARSYHEVYTQGVVKNARRNDIIVQYAKELADAGRKTWIFVKRIEHGRDLQRQIPHSVFLAAQNASVFRQRAMVEKFVKGKIDVLILTNIFDEGVDTPEVDALIMAAGGKSIIETLQRVGRGMRVKADNRLFVFDFFDDTHEFLMRHAETRRRTCESVKYLTEVWNAPKSLRSVCA
jgi:superfamily II DNA or RNA helicase